MDFNNEDDDDDDDITGTFAVSIETMDCSDFFATVLTRKYPEVDAELIFVPPTIWRPHRKITIPHDSPYTIQDVDQYAFELQERLFWDRETFVTYSVTKETKNEEEQSA